MKFKLYYTVNQTEGWLIFVKWAGQILVIIYMHQHRYLCPYSDRLDKWDHAHTNHGLIIDVIGNHYPFKIQLINHEHGCIIA